MTNTDIKLPVPVLREDRLYFGDNGRCFCGRLRCAGMSSHFSGLDLSGHAVDEATQTDVSIFEADNLTLRCEGCGDTYERVQART